MEQFFARFVLRRAEDVSPLICSLSVHQGIDIPPLAKNINSHGTKNSHEFRCKQITGALQD